jgi:FKBP-type peptidyl-prolyl cis-trans isomerase FklB
MKTKLLFAASLSILFGTPMVVCAQAPQPGNQSAPAAAPSDAGDINVDDAGYIYGVNFGQQLYRLGLTNEVPIESIARGLRDGLAGKTTSEDDAIRSMNYLKAINARNIARNQAAAKEFLNRNAAVKGVHQTSSGLQYKIIAAGDKKAASPKPTDVVTVRYSGKLLDGTPVDSSTDAPVSLQYAKVIKGWQEALTLMKPGARWELFVPADLAYGGRFRPGIPLGSMLEFDLELVSVASPGEAKSSTTGDTKAAPAPKAAPSANSAS